MKVVNGLGNVELSGQVEVCLERKWTSVCDTSWTEEDALVVCNQLGYPNSAKLGMHASINIHIHTYILYYWTYNFVNRQPRPAALQKLCRIYSTQECQLHWD